MRAERQQHEDLAALADGSLPEPRRAELQAQVAADPELAAALEAQRRALTQIRAATADIEAPPALRERIEALQAERGRKGLRGRIGRRRAPADSGPSGRLRAPSRRRSSGLGGRSGLVWGGRRSAVLLGGLAASVAAAALAIAVLGGDEAPSARDAAALAARPASGPAPAVDPAAPKRLRATVDGVAFPTWRTRGWRVAGARTDELDGRHVTTVFYDKAGRRLAYTIVAGEPLRGPSRPEAFRTGGRTAVAFVRDGRTCVISSARVPAATLLKLARA